MGKILGLVLLVFILLFSTPLGAREKGRKDKFRGTVVAVGPKAISVRSLNNLYMVRTFNYTPKLEERIQKRKPAAGKKVTVRYYRGTDLATRID